MSLAGSGRLLRSGWAFNRKGLRGAHLPRKQAAFPARTTDSAFIDYFLAVDPNVTVTPSPVAVAVNEPAPVVSDGQVFYDATNSPATLKDADGTATTASFTAPAGSLLFAVGTGDSLPTTSRGFTVADTGSLTWTEIERRSHGVPAGAAESFAQVYWAYAPTAASRTVTFTATIGTQSAMYKVMVFGNTETSYGGTSDVGAQAQTGTVASVTYTTTRANSIVVAAASDWSANTDGTYNSTPATTEVDKWVNTGFFTGSMWRTTAPVASSSTAVTMSRTTSASQTWNIVAWEVRPPASGNVTVTPSVVSVNVSEPAPTVTAVRDVTVTPSVISVSVGEAAPTVTAEQSVTVTPAALAVSVSEPAPTVDAASGAADVTVFPSAVAITVNKPAPTAASSVTVTPSTVAVTVGDPAPTAATSTTITTSTVAVTVGKPAPTVSSSVTVTPSAVSVTVGKLAPTATGVSNVTVNPAALAVTVGKPAPDVTSSGSVTINLGLVAVTVAANAPTAVTAQNVTVTPATVGVTAGTPAPAATSSVTVTPSVVAATVTVPAGQAYIGTGLLVLAAKLLSSKWAAAHYEQWIIDTAPSSWDAKQSERLTAGPTYTEWASVLSRRE